MATRRSVLVLLAFVLLSAPLVHAQQQRAMTADQLTGMVRSNIQQHASDKDVADYIKSRVRLTQRLTQRDVEELQGLGAGPRTIAALKVLADASAGLPAPPPPDVPAPRVTPPAPSQADIDTALRETTDWARDYTKNLPNFITTQVTRRHRDSSGTGVYGLVDTIYERLTYNEHKENYEVVMINDRSVTNIKHEQLGGATSSGEFGSMLNEIFDPTSQATFRWQRWGTLRGKRVHVFEFQVPQATSKYSIYHGETRRQIVVGYHGLIYVDRSLNVVLKIGMDCDIPADFPVQAVHLDLDYDFAKIGDQEHLLPLKFSLKSRDGRILSWNESEFRLYRRFGADTSITFEPIDPLPDDATKEDPAAAEPAKK